MPVLKYTPHSVPLLAKGSFNLSPGFQRNETYGQIDYEGDRYVLV